MLPVLRTDYNYLYCADASAVGGCVNFRSEVTLLIRGLTCSPKANRSRSRGDHRLFTAVTEMSHLGQHLESQTLKKIPSGLPHGDRGCRGGVLVESSV